MVRPYWHEAIGGKPFGVILLKRRTVCPAANFAQKESTGTGALLRAQVRVIFDLRYYYVYHVGISCVLVSRVNVDLWVGVIDHYGLGVRRISKRSAAD
jgi:hypothetical protein